MKKLTALALMLAIAAAAHAGTTTDKRMNTSSSTPIVGATEQAITTGAVHRTAPTGSLDLIGTQYEAGTTWYDYQHNGTAGKMIGVDDMGFVHVVWMNGQDEGSAQRHAFYNCWDPTTEDWQALIPDGGVAIDNAGRAGYVSQTTTPEGFCFPSYHATPPGESQLFSNTAIDFQPCAGAFTPFWPTDNVEAQAIWPKVTVGGDGVLHGVSTDDGDDLQGYHYWRGTPLYDSGFGIQIDFTTFNNGVQVQTMGQGRTISPDVAASPVSDRVAVVWTNSRGGSGGLGQINNDLMLSISEDGGLNFGNAIDLTSWIPSDPSCPSQDTVACNGDTLRPYTDCAILIDNYDNIHVAFTTRTLYEYGVPGSETIPDTIAYINLSSIWHWDELTDEFSCIVNHDQFASFSNGDSLIGDNAWQLMVQRPNLAIDTTNNWLYCTFQRHDSTQYSANYMMSADAWVAGSCNLGRTWYNPINLTNTVTAIGAPAGECNHERDITVAKYITSENGDKYMHVQYELDYDVGGVPQDEGVATQNPIYYLRVPMNDLDFEAQGMRDWAQPTMHIDGSQHTGTGAQPFDPENPCALAADDRRELPQAFQLFQNYPNPFNPSTNIQFDLINSTVVTLKVFNVLGEEVATLVAGQAMNAGAHTIAFDGSALSSGVYMYRLEANGVSTTRKMVLMK
ncbi:MAG: T9SS type A sorting domain-containing protein [Calditrichaeota bacterium]|nr:T9SS type A sorting domain-containing protein [Calditrichota bacterium]